MKRNRKSEQFSTVTKLFIENNIDLSLVSAGRTLYQSLAKAKGRTFKREDYIAKGIKYMFAHKESEALIEIIQGDKEFWQAWIKQNEIFDKTGLAEDRPTIHRPNSNGNYDFGNIAVLSYGVHQQEHAEPTALLINEDGGLSVDLFDSKKKLAQAIGKSPKTANNMLTNLYGVKGTDKTVFAMSVRTLEPTNSEAEYKAQLEAHGFTYEPPELRAERDMKQIARVEQQYKEMCEAKGIDYIPPEVRRSKSDYQSFSQA